MQVLGSLLPGSLLDSTPVGLSAPVVLPESDAPPESEQSQQQDNVEAGEPAAPAAALVLRWQGGRGNGGRIHGSRVGCEPAELIRRILLAHPHGADVVSLAVGR